MGTPVYMSPEHINGAPFDREADTWAFACTLYEAMSLAPPWAELDDGYGGMDGGMPALHERLTTSSLDTSELRAHYPASLCSLLDHLLQRDRSQRLSLDAFLPQLASVRVPRTDVLEPPSTAPVPPPTPPAPPASAALPTDAALALACDSSMDSPAQVTSVTEQMTPSAPS